MEIGENDVTKKVPVFVLKTYEKAGAQKWASPVRDIDVFGFSAGIRLLPRYHKGCCNCHSARNAETDDWGTKSDPFTLP